MKLRDVKKGDFFTLKDYDEPKESQVYVKGNYDYSAKAFCCHKFSDVGFCRLFKSDRDVFTDFVF